MKKYYLVESQSTFKLQYLITANEEPKNGKLQGMIDESKLTEFSQEFLGEKVIGTRTFNSVVELEKQYGEHPDLMGASALDFVNDIDVDILERLSDEETL